VPRSLTSVYLGKLKLRVSAVLVARQRSVRLCTVQATRKLRVEPITEQSSGMLLRHREARQAAMRSERVRYAARGDARMYSG